MPAKSQQQQKLFGLALAVKRGEVPISNVSDDVKNIVNRMSKSDIEDFAGTSRKKLPKKAESKIREVVREIMREKVISEMNEDENPCWKGYEMIGMKMKNGKEVPNCVPKNESVNESDVKKKLNRRGDVDGLLVTHNGKKYEIVYSGDFTMGTSVQPYGIVMPGDDVVSFLGKDKKAKSVWKQLKPKVDKFLKSN